MQNDSVAKTLLVAGLLCVICSVLVSGAAVSLKPMQDLNKKLDIKKNLLLSTGLLTNTKATKEEILEKFSMVEPKIVDIKTGEYVDGMDVENFDQRAAAKSAKSSMSVPAEEDLGKLKTISKHAKVYLVKEEGVTTMIVLPISGKGLWSTLYGFLALAPDTRTVKGIGFYEHGETPGLGGEIDNPKWKASWIGKTVLGENYIPVIDVVKGSVNPSSSMANSQIDGLSGATITSNGVEALVKYWVGQNGLGKFLTNFRQRGE